MENKTNTNPQDWLNSSFLFAKALNLILKEGEGIVIDVDENVVLPDTKKVIVFKLDSQIFLYKCEDDYEEGTVVNMTPQDNPNEQK